MHEVISTVANKETVPTATTAAASHKRAHVTEPVIDVEVLRHTERTEPQRAVPGGWVGGWVGEWVSG